MPDSWIRIAGATVFGDLDLYFLPLNNGDPRDPKELVAYLTSKYKDLKPIEKDPTYSTAPVPYVAKIKMLTKSSGKRIDVFILGGEADVFNIANCLETLQDITIDLGKDRIVNRKVGR